jgi:hypothetical protein
MFLTFPFIDQAISLRFRLLSIQFTSERLLLGISLRAREENARDPSP